MKGQGGPKKRKLVRVKVRRKKPLVIVPDKCGIVLIPKGFTWERIE